MTELQPIVIPDDTCWRTGQADRLAVIVDAADRYRTERARRTLRHR